MNTKDKLLAYLQLMRFPNIFTAMADVLAGYLIVSGTHIQWAHLFGLLLSTSGIYGAGCVFNDLCDRKVDAVERPFRPIPSGQVSVVEATFLAIVLYAIGLLGASIAGKLSFFVALFLVFLTISYDALTKKIPVAGPLNMGACRSCNLVLGMSPVILYTSTIIIYPIISLLYVFIITSLSRFEVEGKPSHRGWSVVGGWCVVILIILVLGLCRILLLDSMVFLTLFGLFTGPRLVKGVLESTPLSIGIAVKTLILGIPLLDAVYSSGAQGFSYGIPVALCLVPSVVVSRYLYVT